MEALYAGLAFEHRNSEFNTVWLCVASHGSLGIEVVYLEQLEQRNLSNLLLAFPAVAVAMCFPFSLPAQFLNYWSVKTGRDQPQSWEGAVAMMIGTTFERFSALARDFAQQPPRLTESQSKLRLHSPLYSGGPNLLRCCFQGIRILASLDPAKFSILPFENQTEGRTVLFETFPVACLQSLGFSVSAYRSAAKREPEKVVHAREQQFNELLSFRDKPDRQLALLPRLTAQKKIALPVHSSPDALDAVIAAYTSALFASRPEFFEGPFQSADTRVLVEGWSYIPSKFGALCPP